MPASTRAPGSDRDRGRRLHLWRGNGFIVTNSLALPGGTAP